MAVYYGSQFDFLCWNDCGEAFGRLPMLQRRLVDPGAKYILLRLVEIFSYGVELVFPETLVGFDPIQGVAERPSNKSATAHPPVLLV